MDENNQYFAEKEENAVINYIRSDSIEEKNKIYNEILIEPFKKMIQSILRKYPIHIGNYDMSEIEANALTHLIENMVKFNPDKITKSGNKTKAFSYCQTIIRNYYRDHSKKTYTEKKIVLNFDECVDEINDNNNYVYYIDNTDNDIVDILIKSIIDEINNKIKTSKYLKRNEILVGDAIINILLKWNILFMEETPVGKYNKKVTNKFAKNKILLYIKEQTGLSTKEIRIAIKPFKEIYYIKKNNLIDEL